MTNVALGDRTLHVHQSRLTSKCFGVRRKHLFWSQLASVVTVVHWQTVKVNSLCGLVSARPLFFKRFSKGHTAALQLGKVKYCISQCALHSPLGPQAACLPKFNESLILLPPGWTHQMQCTAPQQFSSCCFTYRLLFPPDAHYTASIDNISGKVHLWRVYCELHQPQMLQL